MSLREVPLGFRKAQGEVRLGIYPRKDYTRAVLSIGAAITRQMDLVQGTKVKLFYDRAKQRLKVVKDPRGTHTICKDSVYNKGTRIHLSGSYLDIQAYRRSTAVAFNVVSFNELVVTLARGG
jgi:hypothetical protein